MHFGRIKDSLAHTATYILDTSHIWVLEVTIF